MVCALGCEDRLVGRSHECDYPESVKALPACTAPKFNVTGTAYEIDQRVKAILQEGLSVYRVDASKLQDLRPDVIITQTQCEVCAVSLRDVEEAVCTWIGSAPRLVALEPNALDDVWHDIRRVAAALNVSERGDRLVANLQARMTAISRIAAGVPDRPSVACIEWIDPLMAAGNWMPELVAMAGGTNVFGTAGAHAPLLSWDALVQADPDVLFIAPCGWDTKTSREAMGSLTCRPEWPMLRAVREHRVYLADGNQYFNRPGPRLVESLEILAEVLHPDLFEFGHTSAYEQFVAEV
jgi:iron complex transport system substrate-binding protein